MGKIQFSEKDKHFMSRALELASLARGETSPNPVVGCVIVKNGKIIGQGYHRRAGEPHAEILALNQIITSGLSPEGSTVYVTLEPCSHRGTTGACALRLIKDKPARVVVAVKDPNPLVSGKGIDLLRNNGIKVDVGLLEKEGMSINRGFFHYIQTRRPFVTIKSAVSIDGKIATKKGASKWITGPDSRKYVHHLRKYNDAILVGLGTVIKDNPSLTIREETESSKFRIIVDSGLNIPRDSKVLTDKFKNKTIIATTLRAPVKREQELRDMGIDVIRAGEGERVDLALLFEELGKREITTLLVEGGGEINAALIELNLVHQIKLFIAPKIIGGNLATTFAEGSGVETMEEAYLFTLENVRTFGQDVLLEYIKEGRF